MYWSYNSCSLLCVSTEPGTDTPRHVSMYGFHGITPNNKARLGFDCNICVISYPICIIRYKAAFHFVHGLLVKPLSLILLQGRFFDAVVKVYCIHTEPNYSLPWQRKRQYSSTSSGFMVKNVEGQRCLLTNAHSVEYHTQVCLVLALKSMSWLPHQTVTRLICLQVVCHKHCRHCHRGAVLVPGQDSTCFYRVPTKHSNKALQQSTQHTACEKALHS